MNNSGLLKLIFFQIMATLDLHLQNVLQVVSCVWKTSPKSPPKDSTTLRIPIDPDPQWKGFFCCFFRSGGVLGSSKSPLLRGGGFLGAPNMRARNLSPPPLFKANRLRFPMTCTAAVSDRRGCRPHVTEAPVGIAKGRLQRGREGGEKHTKNDVLKRFVFCCF